MMVKQKVAKKVHNLGYWKAAMMAGMKAFRSGPSSAGK
jgi:hypothetical protein